MSNQSRPQQRLDPMMTSAYVVTAALTALSLVVFLGAATPTARSASR
ncbi:MAG: hypothetical protein HZY76_08930 [Anaerolineae bacterium]|nr:MAG: hypothetical protein HZY76_08930 [Anaerolineae bacterium]